MDFTMLSLGVRGYYCLTEPKRFPRLPDGLLTLVEEIMYRSRYMLKKNKRGVYRVRYKIKQLPLYLSKRIEEDDYQRREN